MHSLSLSIVIISAISAVMIGMTKTGVNGLGTLVVPIMAIALGGKPSTGFVLPMLVMADIFGVLYYHRSAHIAILIRIMPWALVGIVLGTITGKLISAPQFRHLIGIVLIFSIIIMLWNSFRKYKKELKPLKGWVSAPFGIAGGFSSMIGNAAGPVMSIYLLMKNLPKNEFIGTTAWFFFIVNVVKLPMQIWIWHNITVDSFIFNLKMLPFIALGAFLGVRIVRIIPEKIYRWIIIVGTIVSSIFLIV